MKSVPVAVVDLLHVTDSLHRQMARPVILLYMQVAK